MMINNTIEVTFYMESNDYINMKEIDKILNIKNAEFYSKGDLFTSPNKKVQFIIEHSYVGKRAVSHYDIYKQNKTGELLLRRKNSSEFIRTRIGCDDAE